MAAKVDFDGGSKPPQLVCIPVRNEKCSFRQIIFSGDFLKLNIGEPGLQWADGGRVSGKDTAGEGVDLVNGYLHQLLVYAGAGFFVVNQLVEDGEHLLAVSNYTF